MRRIVTLATGTFAVAALALGTAAAAAASSGPPIYTNGQTEGAGYSVTNAQFRYVQDSVYLRSPSTFAAIDDGVSWETHLYGTDTVSKRAVKVVLGIGGDPQVSGPYGAWATVNGQPMVTGGDTAFTSGQTVTQSIYYNRAAGVVSVNAWDANGDSFFGQMFVGGNVSFKDARVLGGIDPGSSFAAPSAPVTLGHFTGVKLTTYSGYHGTIAGWYQHRKMIVTSDGTSAGTVRVAPSGLNSSGNSFSAYIEPAS